MYIHAIKIVISTLFFFTCTSCAIKNHEIGDLQICEENKKCELEGNLYVYRGSPASVAEIETSRGCFAVALNKNDYLKYQKNDSYVRVYGTAYKQNYGSDIVSYTLLDREVATGICPLGLILYAEKMDFVKKIQK